MKKLFLLFITLLLYVVNLFSQPVLKRAASLNEYSILYELNGGTNAASNKDSYIENETVTLERPTRSGFKFDGWYWDEE